MKELFEKLEAVNAKSTTAAQQDITFCTSLQEELLKHIAFFSDARQAFKIQAREYLSSQFPAKTNYTEILAQQTDYVLQEWQSMIDETRETFVSEIESYFRKKYRLHFNGYTELNGTQTFPSTYEPLLENIQQQVGTDLVTAGKENLVKELRNIIKYNTEPPAVEDNTIHFTGFFGTDRHRHNSVYSNDHHIETLLLVVSIYLDNKLELSAEAVSQYRQWKQQFKPNHIYQLPGYSIQLYTDGRLDLSFPIEQLAINFFNTFKLASVKRH